MKSLSQMLFCAGLLFLELSCGCGGVAVHQSVAVQDGLFPALPAQLFTSGANVFNQPLDGLDADPNSETIMKNVIAGVPADADHRITIVEWSTPYNVTGGAPLKVNVKGFTDDPQDTGNYGVPADTVKFPLLDGMLVQGSDPHMLIIDTLSHRLFELYGARKTDGTHWQHHGAAVFDLKQDSVRKTVYDGYTSADAAGLPVLPGIVRYDELKNGEIRHALRMTFARTQLYRAQVYPGMHHSNGVDFVQGTPPAYLPMGARLRLKVGVDANRFKGGARTLVICLKRYGVIVADIGTAFAITGTADSTHVKTLFNRGYDGNARASSSRLIDTAGRDIHWSDFEVMPLGKFSTTMKQYP